MAKNWLEKLPIGNYYDTAFSYKDVNWVTQKKEENTKVLVPTGSSEKFKINNIYDMTGNIDEITTETSGTSMLSRGGNFNNPSTFSPAGYRNNLDSTYSGKGVSFRPVLYK